jgi:hypothetical protein
MKTLHLALTVVLTLAALASRADTAAVRVPAPGEATALQPRRFDTNPLITRASSASLGDNINGPSIIRVPAWVQDPKGKYYMYFAHHDGQFIRMAYADNLQGPWKIYEPGALQLQRSGFDGHIASPDVHVDETNHRLLMYYHGVAGYAQRTGVAVSTTGLDFTSVPGATNLGNYYFRVFAYRGWKYALAKNRNSGGELLRSEDGLSRFEKGKDMIPFMRHVAVLIRGDLAYLFYSRGGDAPERILCSTLSLTADWRSWEPSPAVEVIRPVETYEGAGLPIAPSDWGAVAGPVNQLRDPAVFEEDGKVYIFYSIAGEQGIAAVELEGLAVK